jgi:hypothetical protein
MLLKKHIIALISYVFLMMGLGCTRTTVSLTSKSPSGKWEVSLSEHINYGDRNFDIFLKNTQNNTQKIIFTSPDEGGVGTEKIFWSRDNRAFMLCGKKFSISPKDKIKYKDDVEIYLLYDVEMGNIYCNATQKRMKKIDRKVLQAYGFMKN